MFTWYLKGIDSRLPWLSVTLTLGYIDSRLPWLSVTLTLGYIDSRLHWLSVTLTLGYTHDENEFINIKSYKLKLRSEMDLWLYILLFPENIVRNIE
jgi:hypothetical protein